VVTSEWPSCYTSLRSNGVVHTVYDDRQVLEQARVTPNCLRTVLAIGSLLALARCSGNPATPSSSPAPTVTVSGLERLPVPLTPGAKVQFTATLTPGSGNQQDCTATATWSSSDPSLLRPTGLTAGEFVAVAVGETTVLAVCSGATGRLAVRVEKATSWAVSGRVVVAPDGAPIADAALAFGTAAPVRSDGAGAYTIVTTDSTVQPLTITASGFQTRQTYLRGGEVRTVDIDLIGNAPVFPFALYRMLARNGYESPQSVTVAPTQRWTSSPNVYIWTTWKDTGQPVANVDFYVSEIRRVIPQLTGGRFEAGAVEYGPAERPLTTGWIHVQFHHSGNWSYVARNPGQLQLGADHRCNSMAVIHEFGHAMGYWHSNVQFSVMGGGYPPAGCAPIDLIPDEQLVARVMYSRPPGNVEPDRDPPSTSLARPASADAAIVYCDGILRR
jgi:hypothetical protein